MIYTASAGYHDSVQLAMVRRRMLRQDPSLMGAEWSIDPHGDDDRQPATAEQQVSSQRRRDSQPATAAGDL